MNSDKLNSQLDPLVVNIFYENSSIQEKTRMFIDNLNEHAGLNIEVLVVGEPHSDKNNIDSELMIIKNNSSRNVVLAFCEKNSFLANYISLHIDVPLFGISAGKTFGGMAPLLGMLETHANNPIATFALNDLQTLFDTLCYLQRIPSLNNCSSLTFIVDEVIKNYEYYQIHEQGIKRLGLEYNFELNFINRNEIFAVLNSLNLEEEFPLLIEMRAESDVQGTGDLFDESFEKKIRAHSIPLFKYPLLDSHFTLSHYKFGPLYDWLNSNGLWFGVNNGVGVINFLKQVQNTLFPNEKK